MHDLVKTDFGYSIYTIDGPLKTRNKKDVFHSNQRLLQQIILEAELPLLRMDQVISMFSLLEFQIDYIDDKIDFIDKNFQLFTELDEFIALKTGRTIELSKRFTELPDADDPLFNLLFWGSSSLIPILNEYINDNIRWVELDEAEEHPFILLLKQEYLALPPAKKTAVNALALRHYSGIVLPLLLVLDKITPSEYAKGVFSIICGDSTVVKREMEGYPTVDVFPPIDLATLPSDLYSIFLGEAFTVIDFLAYFKDIHADRQQLMDMIKKGESGNLEFKSTFRWDLKQNKTNNAVERASLKTISGFLNSAGGILLIGVRDDGSIEGIESDRFPNEDKFLLHLWTLIRTSLGRDVSPYVQTSLEKKEERTVCVVKCTKSPQPVFLRQPGFEEEFYIRVGPSSNALDISEALRYISLNF